MFKEPIEPVFKFKKTRFVLQAIFFGLVMLIFLESDIIFLLLGIFLVVSSVFIVVIDWLDYKRKLNFYKNRVQKIRDSQILQIDRFSGEKFEFYLKKLFEDLGYRKIQTTKKTRDFGVDLIMFNETDKKIIIQAKRYKGTVGIDAINEVVGTRLPEKADEVWVVTNSYFTKPAIEHASKNAVKLINREELIDLILNRKSKL
jgi:restriction system protein